MEDNFPKYEKINFKEIIEKRKSRPKKEERCFISDNIDKYIEKVKAKIKNSEIATIFENCYPNTLDTTIYYNEKLQDTFIITGDIRAMWLRDSSLQVYPYIKHCKEDKKLNNMLLYLFKRQIKSILIDPYANAFNYDTFQSPWFNDESLKKNMPAMNESLWERKFELDSIMFPFFIMCKYNELNNSFDFINEQFIECLKLVIDVVIKEQRGTDQEDDEGGPEYFFQRNGKEPFDSCHQGRGNPCKTCGLVKCNFRNSDDTTLFSYNIPENALLVCTFDKLIKVLKDFTSKNEFCKDIISDLIIKMSDIKDQVKKAIYKYGVKIDNQNKKYFVYEVDGYGNYLFMDEPGYPSIISMPFFEFLDKNDEIFKNTKEKILSDETNPYYINGKDFSGCASSHSYRKYIWPLFTIMQGLVSDNKEEIKKCLNLLLDSSKDSGFIHESFDVNNPSKYTRSWFAWANSFFGIFIEKIIEEHPDLLK